MKENVQLTVNILISLMITQQNVKWHLSCGGKLIQEQHAAEEPLNFAEHCHTGLLPPVLSDVRLDWALRSSPCVLLASAALSKRVLLGEWQQ